MLLIKVGIVPLSHGGFFLRFEKKSDAVKISGSINSVESVAYYLYARSEVYFFQINDTECVGIYADDVPLSTGDYGDVLYLPRNGYILSIEEIDDP